MTNGKLVCNSSFSEADSMRIHDDDLRWSIWCIKENKGQGETKFAVCM